MPAFLYTEEIKTKLPSGLTRAEINSLKPSSNISGKYVQAKVQHRYQHNRLPQSSLKLVLSDSGHTIDLLAIGQVADDLDVCEKGDTLVCLNFEVEACPRHYHRPYQIVADDTGPVSSLIWVFKEKPIKKKDTTAGAPFQSNNAQTNSSKSITKPPSYSYKPLAKVEVNTVVDVYGVVSFCKPPQKTRGSDYYCNLGLTDPSFDNPEEKLTCNIFNKDVTKLPKLAGGDIVRFHRLKIQNYQGRKQGYNGPGFHWLAFRDSINVQSSSSSSYTFEEKDKDKVQELLSWWSTVGCGVSSTSSRTTLSQVQPKDFFDLVCQVIRTCTLDANCQLLRVWDGTKFQSSQIKKVKEQEFNDTVREDETLMKASEYLAVDVFLFDNHAAPAEIIKPGDFILLTNLHAAVVAEQVEITLHGGTWFNRKFEVLSGDSAEAGNLKATLDCLIEKHKEIVAVDQDNNEEGECGNDDGAETANTSSSKETVLKTRVLKRKNRDSSIEDPGMKDDLTVSGRTKKCSVYSPVCKKGNIPDADPNTSPAAKCSSARVKEAQADRYVMDKNVSGYSAAGLAKGVEILQNLSGVSSSQGSDHSCPDLDPPMALELSPTSNEKKCNTPALRKRNRPRDGHSPSKASSGNTSTESVWLSAFDDSDFEMELRLAQDCQKQSDTAGMGPENIQDESISSSGNSREDSPQEAIDIDSQAGKSAQRPKTPLSQNQLKTTPVLCSSDESFTTVPSQEEVKSIDASAKVFLSLKSNKPKQAKPSEEGNELLAFTQEDYSSMDSCVLCFETATFTKSDKDSQVLAPNYETHVEETERDSSSQFPHHSRKSGESVILDVPVQEHSISPAQLLAGTGAGEGSQVSSSSGSNDKEEEELPARCLLKTASVILGHTHVPVTRLKDVLAHEVPHKFRILVRLQEFHPRPATAKDLVYCCCDFCHFFSPVSKVENSMGGSSVYCPDCTRPLIRAIVMTLLLRDGDYSLQAILWDKSATQFFCGMEPVELLSNERASEQVSQWMEELCPVGSAIKDRPWLECCVFSYHVGNDVKYQIFDTALVK